MENKVYLWREIVTGIKSPYNTYVFVSMRNSGKSKSIRNLVVELLREIPHHNIILFSTTAHRELNDDYKFLQDSKYAKIYPGSKDEIDQHIDGILKHCKVGLLRLLNFGGRVLGGFRVEYLSNERFF